MKPIVHYRLNELHVITVGLCAYVHALDHPRLGNRNVKTSTVISVDADGRFETQNTHYVPEGVA